MVLSLCGGGVELALRMAGRRAGKIILYGVLCWYTIQCCVQPLVFAIPLWDSLDEDQWEANTSNATSPPPTVPIATTVINATTVVNTTTPVGNTSTPITSSTITQSTPKVGTTGANTIAPRPTEPGPSRPFQWNKECVSLAVSNITFQYRRSGKSFLIKTGIPLLNQKYGVPEPEVKSYCPSSGTRATLELFWKSSNPSATDNFNFTMVFAQVSSLWQAVELLHTDSNEKPYRYADQDYFQSPLATVFECSQRSTSSIDGSAALNFVNVKVQAFTFGNGFSKSVNDCPENQKRDAERNLGLIVGASLGSIVFVGVGALLIGKSALREYELLK